MVTTHKMANFKILNSKKVKEILEVLNKQFDYKEKLDYAMVQTQKDRIYLVNKDIGEINFHNMKINSFGMYFCEWKHNEVRLSIEGSQLVGPKAKKNILQLSDKQTIQWMNGEEIEIDRPELNKQFLIIKNNQDFLGSGKIINNRLLNFVPKVRRLHLSS